MFHSYMYMYMYMQKCHSDMIRLVGKGRENNMMYSINMTGKLWLGGQGSKKSQPSSVSSLSLRKSTISFAACSLRTKLILVPSQRDVHHPWAVYPQPPFHIQISSESQDRVFATSDPSTLTVNGLCVGMTSTDILFHLSARSMFRGWVFSFMIYIHPVNRVL